MTYTKTISTMPQDWLETQEETLNSEGIHYQNIPQELKDLKQWVCFKMEEVVDEKTGEKKQKKVPKNPNGIYNAKINDTKTWGTFSEAVESCRKNGYENIAFALTENDPYCGIDIDKCLDENGVFNAISQEILNLFKNTYSEYSRSGTGIHIIFKGDMSEKGRKNPKFGLEFYKSDRFLVCTGNVINDLPINQAQDEINSMYEKYFKREEIQKERPDVTPLSLSDNELLDKARSAPNGSDFSNLYDHGGLSKYNDDHSSADLALCTKLAFWAQGDFGQINSLFTSSALYRKKWDRQDYKERTINKAIIACDSFYDPHFNSSSGKKTSKKQEPFKQERKNIETTIPTELILNSKTPYNSAECLIKNRFTYLENRIVYFCGDAFWLWKKKYYEEVKPNKIRQDVYDFLNNAKVEVKKKIDPKSNIIELIGFDPNTSKVDNVIDAMKAICDSEQTPESGASWIENRNFRSTKNLIIFSNGILDFEKWILDKSTPLIPHTPLLLNPSYLPFDYNPQAKKPLNWIQFLNTIWKDDPQSIETLQEWFGLCLSQDLKFHKILMLVGPPRSGKGTIARILSIILGALNVVNPTLASLSGAFGLQSWLNKSVAIISDARLSNKSDSGIIKERLLSISGEDSLTIDRKHRESITTTLPARIMILSNELPNLEDASSAMASRFLVLSLTESFLGKEDLELEIRIRSELPEILLWALQGLERLRKRKRFVQPDSAKQHIEDLYAMTSPVKSFLDDRCELGDTKWIETKSLFKAWKSWCDDNGHDRSGTEQLLGRNLKALYPHIKSAQGRDANKNRIRIYKCVGLQVLSDL